MKPKPYPAALLTIGDHIKKKRIELKFFQSQLADLLGVDEMTIVNWEKNYKSPKVSMFPRIYEFLGYEPEIKVATLGEKIKAYRRRLGLSQEKFAKKLGIDSSTLRKWEWGETGPSGTLLVKLSPFFVSINSSKPSSQ